jgi:hypothetical protein
MYRQASDLIKFQQQKNKNLSLKQSTVPNVYDIRDVSKKFGEWYQKTKKNRRYKQINCIGLKNHPPSQHTVGNVHKDSENCQKMPLRLRAPDQGSTVDFFLFHRLKSFVKGASFADVTAIQERVRAVLRSIPKEAFTDSFQKLYKRSQQCVVKDGDYFEDQ